MFSYQQPSPSVYDLLANPPSCNTYSDCIPVHNSTMLQAFSGGCCLYNNLGE